MPKKTLKHIAYIKTSTILYLSIILLNSSISHGTIIRNLNFEELISCSSQIIVGDISSIEEIYEDIVPKTYYTICNLEIIGGKPLEECIYIDIQGTAENPDIEQMTYLQINKRYILFITKSEKYFSPFCGWQQGIFEVKNNNHEEVVLNYNGFPILAFDELNNDFIIGGYEESNFLFEYNEAYAEHLEDYALPLQDFISITNQKINNRLRDHLSVPAGRPDNQRSLQFGDILRSQP